MLKLSFDEYGGGPPLVLLHGLFGSSTNWRTIARQLGKSRRVLAVDLRNHGESPHADDMSYPAMVEDLLELVQRECDGRADVMGHSMGGKAAMGLALTHPDAVDRLIAVDIAPVDYGHGEVFERYIELLKAVPLDEITSRRAADELLAPGIPQPAIRAFLLQNLRAQHDRWSWRINLDAIADSIEVIAGFPFAAAEPFDGPTLFVGGGASDYVQERYHPIIKRLFPRARIERIKDAGHWVHAEQPEALLARIEEFLA